MGRARMKVAKEFWLHRREELEEVGIKVVELLAKDYARAEAEILVEHEDIPPGHEGFLMQAVVCREYTEDGEIKSTNVTWSYVGQVVSTDTNWDNWNGPYELEATT